MSHNKIFIKSRVRSFTPEELPKLLDLINKMADSINANPLVDSENVEITTPATLGTSFKVALQHLQRPPIGYEIIRKDKAVDIYDAPDQAWGNGFFWIRASVGNVRVTLRVF